jgi:NAD(P)-dependent dehydrogenase (short-subunit alcohol dehydrogenase family)
MSTRFPGLGPDKVVLVSAGASGIGRCIAEAFLAQDCRVHVFDIDSVAISDFLTANPAASATLADVGEPAQVAEVFVELEQHYQRLDVLVNNAGIAGPTAVVEDIAIADWEQTIRVDLSGAFYCTRLAVPLLRRQGGSIVNMASNAALFGCPLRSPYTAAKWALAGLTKTWAMELGAAGIRVNALCPGSVNGDRIEGVLQRDAAERGLEADQVREMYTRQSSMGLFVEPGEIAAMGLFLASDLGASISGQSIGIDGHTETLAS